MDTWEQYSFQLPHWNLLELACWCSLEMTMLGSTMNSSPLASSWLMCQKSMGNPCDFYPPPPSHNLQVSVRDNLAGLSAFGHKGSSRLTYHYQCPACLGSIVQKTHFHLPLTIQKLICKSNGLHLSICPAAVYCVHVGKSTSEAFKWISVLCNAPSMNCSN